MNTVLERNTAEKIDVEKEQHNAMIKERYRQLLSDVEYQTATLTVTEEKQAESTFAPEAPVYNAVEEQTPQVRTYTPTMHFAPSYTETVERTATVDVAPLRVNEVQTVKEAEVHYSLTPFAKLAMAIFTFVVVVMLSLIGINSRTLRQKNMEIQILETRKQELVERNEEVQRHIQELQTETSIIERAEAAGLLN